MTPEQQAALVAELTSDPQALGYAPLVASRDDVGLADLLNAPRGTRTVSRFCNERTILANYVDGPVVADQVLTKLEAFAADGKTLSSLVRRAMKYVGQPDGLDLGAATTMQMLGALEAGGVITATEMANLAALAQDPSSRALDLFGERVSVGDVSDALNARGAA